MSILIAVLLAVAAPPGIAEATEPPPTDQAAWLFDSHRVVEIDLEVPQASIGALEADPDEYREATLTLKAGGKTHGSMKVGLRLKGTATLRTFKGKPAFKVKFNEFVKGQKLEGLKKLTLNNMLQDRSMLRETLAYDVFRNFGVAAPRTGYAFVRVNGEAFGLYANVETLDDVSLPRWFSSTQHLYEGSPGNDLLPGNETTFEVDEGDDEDLADLEALIAAANGVVGDWSDGMAATADLQQMTRMWAVERYVGHWDGYAGLDEPVFDTPNNFYLHSGGGLFAMLPWGTDQTWEVRLQFDEDGGLLFDRCLADASCKALYVSALEELRPVVAGLELDRRAQEIAALLAPCQATEDPARREATAADLQSAVISSREFIAERPGELADWLGVEPGQSAPEGPPAGGGEQPCPPLPKPESSAETGSPPPPTPGRLWIGRTRVLGAIVSTTLALPSPGRAGLRVDVAAGGRSAVACRASRNSRRAGLITLQCRLASWARRKLKRTRLRLKVTFSFAPAGAEPTFRTRHLALPRRSPS